MTLTPLLLQHEPKKTEVVSIADIPVFLVVPDIVVAAVHVDLIPVVAAGLVVVPVHATRQNRELTEVKFHYSKLLSSSIKRSNSRAILTRLP